MRKRRFEKKFYNLTMKKYLQYLLVVEKKTIHATLKSFTEFIILGFVLWIHHKSRFHMQKQLM